MAVTGAAAHIVDNAKIYGAAAALGVFVAAALRWYRRRQAEAAARRWRNKVVWVTGASSGIGEAIALELARHGARLILSARRERLLQQVAARCRAVSKWQCTQILPFDLEDPGIEVERQADAAARLWGDPVQAVFLNGGISSRGAAELTDLSVDERLMRVNFLSNVALAKGFLPEMVRRRDGIICVTSSVQGRLALPFRSSYSASKHALQGYFESLRAEVADRGITVTIACPGYVRTQLSRNAVNSDGSQYGIEDPTTAAGESPSAVARRVVRAAAQGVPEVGSGRLTFEAAILARAIAPGLMAKVMARRARKQRQTEGR
eukprot:TRINITY_DN15443_c0_g1_i1.p1 TRINITY_DN15443_c0_g1~~TRINITY_DN15443_c0_g1_i1.p1  ORF type:complete len:349 (+),score=113.36 TRINITY_DN15443_c0_g1_i1:90-1049(+)